MRNVLYKLFDLEFEPGVKAYNAEKNGEFQKIATFDCRGLELVDFSPRVSVEAHLCNAIY